MILSSFARAEETFGCASQCGAPLFDAIAANTADDVLEISIDSAEEIRTVFVEGFASSEYGRNLYPVPFDCDM